MSCHYCLENCCSQCLTLSDAFPTGGNRFIGINDSSSNFNDVSVQLCRGSRFFTLTVAVTQVSGPTGATGTFTLVRGGIGPCVDTIGQVNLPLKVNVPLVEGDVRCASVSFPAIIFPGQKVALLVESSNHSVIFSTEAMLC